MTLPFATRKKRRHSGSRFRREAKQHGDYFTIQDLMGQSFSSGARPGIIRDLKAAGAEVGDDCKGIVVSREVAKRFLSIRFARSGRIEMRRQELERKKLEDQNGMLSSDGQSPPPPPERS